MYRSKSPRGRAFRERASCKPTAFGRRRRIGGLPAPLESYAPCQLRCNCEVLESRRLLSAISTIATFTKSNGANPEAALLDVGGNLNGTTINGGSHSDGTVFEYNSSTAQHHIDAIGSPIPVVHRRGHSAVPGLPCRPSRESGRRDSFPCRPGGCSRRRAKVP
jgi:hypothetical protein